MKELYLYHATGRENLQSILRSGLLIDPPVHNWEDMYCEKQIFLAFDSNVAESYAESSEEPPEEIVVLKIKLSDLNENSFCYDWNNRCEYSDEINSVAYEENIPASVISIVEDVDNEPYQDLSSFRKTQMYNIIMDTFDYEVETNKESED